MRKLRQVTPDAYRVITAQILVLRAVREQLRGAGAIKAAEYVARALKSVEGAERHAGRAIGTHARARS